MSLKVEDCNLNKFDDFEPVHYKTLREWTAKCAMSLDLDCELDCEVINSISNQ